MSERSQNDPLPERGRRDVITVCCPECQTRFRVERSRIPAQGAKGRCSRCRAVFTLTLPPGREEPVLLGVRPDPDRAAVEAARRAGRRTDLPGGLDDPALTQKIDTALLRAARESQPPRPMTYSHLAEEETAPPNPAGIGSREQAAHEGVAAHRASVAAASPPASPLGASRVAVGRAASAALVTDGAVEPAPEPLPQPLPPENDSPAPSLKLYRLPSPEAGLEGAAEEILEKREIVLRIREGNLLEDDAIARKDEDWTRAGDLPELARYFALAAGSDPAASPTGPLAPPAGSGVPLACLNHPDRPPGWQCTGCEQGLCDECTETRQAGMSAITVCRSCGGAAREIPRAREDRPFWQDLPNVLRFCVSGGGLLMTLIYAVMYWAAWFAISAPIPGMFKGMLLFSAALILLFLVTFDMIVVRAATDGRKTMPDWPEFHDWGEIIGRGLKGFVVWLALHAPIFLFAYWTAGDVIGLAMASGSLRAVLGLGVLFFAGIVVLSAAAYAFYPMCFALVSNFQSVPLALNPSAVLGSISRILPEYLVFLALQLVLIASARLLHLGFWVVLPLGAGIPAALLHAYTRLTAMHMLGRALYQTEHKIGWDQ